MLVVRSSFAVRARLGALLSKGKCRMFTIASFSGAVRRLGRTTPRLIVLSVGLPKGGNFRVYSKVHAFSSVPVMFMADDGASVSRLGDVVLNKSTFVAGPCGPTVLLTGVTTLLGGTCHSPRARVCV